MKILNFGSLNIDRVYSVAGFVRPGETIHADSLHIYPGGKGLNQSLAAARAGAEVIHGGAVGPEGAFLLRQLSESGVDAARVRRVDVETGHAVIQVNASGQNCIIVFGGANQCLSEDYVEEILALGCPGDYVLVQNETNAVGGIMRRAHERGLKVVFNPSPFPQNREELPLELVSCFMVNETEGAALAGMEAGVETDKEAVLDALARRYPQAAVVLTLGSGGAAYQQGRTRLFHPAYAVPVADTTAAGDTFCGYFLAGLCLGRPVERCLAEASAAAAIAVSRPGAAQSIPYYRETAAFLESR